MERSEYKKWVTEKKQKLPVSVMSPGGMAIKNTPFENEVIFTNIISKKGDTRFYNTFSFWGDLHER